MTETRGKQEELIFTELDCCIAKLFESVHNAPNTGAPCFSYVLAYQ